MEIPADSGAGKKPQRPAARPTGSTRKPPPARKPVAKRSASTAHVPGKAAAAGPAAVEPATAPPELEVPEELAEVVQEPVAETSVEPEPEPEPAPPAEDSPKHTLSDLAAWTKRVATITGARIATLSERTATGIRTGVTAAAARVSIAGVTAKERADTARLALQERSTARQLAHLDTVSAEPSIVESSLAFEIIPAIDPAEYVLAVRGLTKHFDDTVAVSGIDLRVRPGSFYGIVGPNGAGKTTTLSMISGLLRPDAGTITVHGADVWSDPVAAKRNMGVLPDRLRLFDRLTGAQLLFYAGVLRGMDAPTVKRRSADLAVAFGLEEALPRLVSDYSAGMTKKIALAAALIHSPRLLVLDEPFEAVDPVSSVNVTHVLKQYAAAGGTVLLSSHSMDLVQRICDNVAVVVGGVILADGTMDEVRDGRSLEERFVELAGARTSSEGLAWLRDFSD